MGVNPYALPQSIRKLASFPSRFQAMKAEGIRGRRPTVLYRPGAVGKGHKAAVVSETLECSRAMPMLVKPAIYQFTPRRKRAPPATAERCVRSTPVNNLYCREPSSMSRKETNNIVPFLLRRVYHELYVEHKIPNECVPMPPPPLFIASLLLCFSSADVRS